MCAPSLYLIVHRCVPLGCWYRQMDFFVWSVLPLLVVKPIHDFLVDMLQGSGEKGGTGVRRRGSRGGSSRNDQGRPWNSESTPLTLDDSGASRGHGSSSIARGKGAHTGNRTISSANDSSRWSAVTVDNDVA